MKSTLYLARHGQTEWNLIDRFQGQLDSPLTELGKKQALQTREKLLKKNIHIVYSSPLSRALDTAKIISQGWPVELHTCDDLMGMRLNQWQGKTLVEIQRTYPEEFANFYVCPNKFNLPGAENYFDLEERVTNSIHNILRKYTSHNILVVTHGIVIKTLISHVSTNSVAGIADVDLLENGSFICLKVNE